jgi:DNA-binding MarR family transcriptional regulator
MVVSRTGTTQSMSGFSQLMIFSPQNCTLEVLDQILTPKRRKVAEQIIKAIEESIQTKTSHHHLVVGPRGAGKTHLLAYIRKQINNDKLKIISFSEEERGVSSFFDFLIVALRLTGVSNSEIQRHFQGCLPDERENSAIEMLETQIQGHHLLIVCENLSDLFGHKGFQKDLLSLRKFLQNHPEISLLASTVEMFSKSQKADHPFYGFFHMYSLQALEEKEVGPYLKHLATLKGDHELANELDKDILQPRIKAIFHLTGGNHRLLAMLSLFLTLQGMNELVQPFVQMVDRELTPYYQQKLDRLSDQQNKVLHTLAEHQGAAMNVQEIADYIFSTSQTVSKVLHDLLALNYVLRHPVGRESYYELREPLLRLVLDIKQGREKPLQLIVEFLKNWYAIKELASLSEKTPKELLSHSYLPQNLKESLLTYEPVVGDFKQALDSDLNKYVIKEIIERIHSHYNDGNTSRVLELIPYFTSQFPKRIDAQSIIFSVGLSCLIQEETKLKNLLLLYKTNPLPLINGTTLWLEASQPFTKGNLNHLDLLERLLTELFSPLTENMRLILNIVQAVKGDVSGDRKALLQLPLEVRSLINPQIKSPRSTQIETSRGT